MDYYATFILMNVLKISFGIGREVNNYNSSQRQIVII